MKLPPATTFAEGQRAIALWLMIGSGFFYGLGTIAVILLFWMGGFSQATEPQRIMYIAIIGISYAFGSIAVTLALAVGGPVGRFKGKLGRDGAELEAEEHEPPSAPMVMTTTTVAPTSPAIQAGNRP